MRPKVILDSPYFGETPRGRGLFPERRFTLPVNRTPCASPDPKNWHELVDSDDRIGAKMKTFREIWKGYQVRLSPDGSQVEVWDGSIFCLSYKAEEILTVDGS